MQRPILLTPQNPILHLMADGALVSTLSTLALLWRGRIDTGSAAAPVNAISHWFWPREALRRDDTTLKHTGTGAALHYASSLLWAALYGWQRSRRLRPTPLNAVADAAAVTALAAVVDLKLVPERLTPGFERRLSPRSLLLVYGSFGAGLALGGVLALRAR